MNVTAQIATVLIFTLTIMNQKNKNYHYYGLFLDAATKSNLINKLTNSIDFIMSEADKIFLDHCTLMHISQHEDWLQSMLEHDLDKTFHITITGIGLSKKAMAFRVQRSGIATPCKNKVPYITIATLNGGKPVDSNGITDWKEIPPIVIEVELRKVGKFYIK